jgi:hypothetical protein
LRIIGGSRLAGLIVIIGEIAGGARGRERAHHEKPDLRRALHRQIFSWSMIFSENRFPLFGIML